MYSTQEKVNENCYCVSIKNEKTFSILSNTSEANNKRKNILFDILCVKSVQIHSFFWFVFPRVRTRQIPHLDTFNAVIAYLPPDVDLNVCERALKTLWNLNKIVTLSGDLQINLQEFGHTLLLGWIKFYIKGSFKIAIIGADIFDFFPMFLN